MWKFAFCNIISHHIFCWGNLNSVLKNDTCSPALKFEKICHFTLPNMFVISWRHEPRTHRKYAFLITLINRLMTLTSHKRAIHAKYYSRFVARVRKIEQHLSWFSLWWIFDVLHKTDREKRLKNDLIINKMSISQHSVKYTVLQLDTIVL